MVSSNSGVKVSYWSLVSGRAHVPCTDACARAEVSNYCSPDGAVLRSVWSLRLVVEQKRRMNNVRGRDWFGFDVIYEHCDIRGPLNTG